MNTAAIATAAETVTHTRAAMLAASCSYSGVIAGKTETTEAFEARVAIIRGREAARDAAAWTHINALIALAAAEDAAR